MFRKKFIYFTVIFAATVLLASGCSTPGQNSDAPSGQNGSPQGQAGQENGSGNTDSTQTVVYFFWGEGCPHCEKQKPWLEELEGEYPDLEVKMLETYGNKDNARLFQQMAQAYGIQARGVPATFIGDYEPVVGFSERMKPGIEDKIKTCLDEGCIDPASKL